MIARDLALTQQSQQHEDFAIMLQTLANIEDSSSSEPDDAVRRAVDESRISLEVIGAVRLSMAAGRQTFSDSSVKRIFQELRNGNKVGAITQVAALCKTFAEEAYLYRKQLQASIKSKSDVLHRLERSRNRRALTALTLQIAGLVLLLLKEIPART